METVLLLTPAAFSTIHLFQLKSVNVKSLMAEFKMQRRGASLYIISNSFKINKNTLILHH